MEDSTVFICLTPVKNEDWILDSFLQLNSAWADYIVVLDQNSSDRSKEIASKYENVILRNNPSEVFNEDERQLMLIEEARKLPGSKKILIALDSDEVLSANFHSSNEWQQIKDLPKGTVIKMPWFNVYPDKKSGWFTKKKVPFGFVDDNSPHYPKKMHSTRIPFPENAPIFECQEILNLHFQYIDPIRNRKKQRWYMCWEYLNFPNKHPVNIFRQYNKLMLVNSKDLVMIKPEWVKSFNSENFSIFESKGHSYTWWDEEILAMFQEYGVEKFRKLDIWDENWTALADKYSGAKKSFNDPRNKLDKIILKWLKNTQSRNAELGVRFIQKMIQVIW